MKINLIVKNPEPYRFTFQHEPVPESVRRTVAAALTRALREQRKP